MLRHLGVGKGERVFTLLGRVPELHVAVLGTLKSGSVCSPLFSAFGPEPIRARLMLGDARVLATSAALYAKKVEVLRPALAGLAHVLLTDVASGATPAGTHSLPELMGRAEDDFEIPQFVVGLHDRLGVEVPEADYARLRTLAGCRSYLAERVGVAR